jgi:hypothetical protein
LLEIREYERAAQQAQQFWKRNPGRKLGHESPLESRETVLMLAPPVRSQLPSPQNYFTSSKSSLVYRLPRR